MERFNGETLILLLTAFIVILAVLLIAVLSRGRSLRQQEKQFADLRVELNRQMSDYQLAIANELREDLTQFNESTGRQLSDLQEKVDGSLRDGYRQSSQAYGEVLKQMGELQKTQNSLDALSQDIAALQNVLIDKKSRGIYGETELYAVLENAFGYPNDARYRRQVKLADGVIVDAVVIGPRPLGLIPIDSKFPLENYNRMYDGRLSKAEQEAARRAFRSDCLKHLQDIADKYIIPGVTADFAYLFVPAEAVFAEIYGHYDEVVQRGYQLKVFIVSPTTLMAYLTAIKAIYLSQAKNEKVDEMQEHLGRLEADFRRFGQRWSDAVGQFDKLHQQIAALDTSARKIVKTFEQIDAVQWDSLPKGEDHESDQN